MVCRNCGNENMPGVANCARCGAYLGYPSTPPTYGATYPTTPPAYGSSSYPTYPTPEATGMPGKGAGITSLVFGIISIVLCWIPFLPIVTGLVGLILGIVGKSSASSAGRTNGVAIAGLICSAVMLGFYVFGLIIGLMIALS